MRLTIEADQISASAREKIEKAGGTVTMREAGAEHARAAVKNAEQPER